MSMLPFLDSMEPDRRPAATIIVLAIALAGLVTVQAATLTSWLPIDALPRALSPAHGALSAGLGLLALLTAAIPALLHARALAAAQADLSELQPGAAATWSGRIAYTVAFASAATARGHPAGLWCAFGVLVCIALIRSASGVGQGIELARESLRREAVNSHPLADNIIGLGSALAFIVLSYAFGLEAFRIPTGSMEPTLFGHESMGDRALVNKLAYRLGDPQRGDIAVLRFPLNRSQPYVKRIVGQPGELVVIAQGDVYVQAEGEPQPRMWVKDGGVREAHWLPVWRFTGSETVFRERFLGLKGEAAAKEGAITLTASASGEARIRFPRDGSIKNHNPAPDQPKEAEAQYNSEIVGDLRIRCTLPKPTPGLSLTIVNGDIRSSLIARESDWLLRVDREGAAPVETPLTGVPLFGAISFAVADGLASLIVDGTTATPLVPVPTPAQLYFDAQVAGKTMPDLTTPAGIERLRRALPNVRDTHIEIALASGQSQISDFALDRDVHYQGRRFWEEQQDGNTTRYRPSQGASVATAWRCGPDEYFALGDNTENSLDSRLWYCVELQVGDRAHRMQLTDLAMLDQDTGARWFALGTNALAGAPGAPSVADFEKEWLAAVRSRAFGQTIQFLDIYGIRRSVEVGDVTALRLLHTPGVPRGLIDGRLTGSVFPRPRLVD